MKPETPARSLQELARSFSQTFQKAQTERLPAVTEAKHYAVAEPHAHEKSRGIDHGR